MARENKFKKLYEMLNVLLEKLQFIWCSQKHTYYIHDSPPGKQKIELVPKYFS